MNLKSLKQALSLWNRRRLQRRKYEQQRQAVCYPTWLASHLGHGAHQPAWGGGVFATRFLVMISVTEGPGAADKLRATVESLIGQSHQAWELVASLPPVAGTAVQWLCQTQQLGAKLSMLNDHGGERLVATVGQPDAMTGGFVLVLEPGDVLHPDALLAMAKVASSCPDVKVVYADEDRWDSQGHRGEPRLKPAWNLALWWSTDYVGMPVAIKPMASLAPDALLTVGASSLKRQLLADAVCDGANGVVRHIPLVLGSVWCEDVSALSTGNGHAVDEERVKWMVRDLTARGLPAALSLDHGVHRLRFQLPAVPPRVSVIILTRDRPKLLETCVRSVLEGTAYPNIEFIVVDNGTVDPVALRMLEEMAQDPRVQVIRDDSPFNFAALNNRAVELAKGELLCLLNNDVEVLNGDWLNEMVALSVLPGMGVVGARLLFPDRRLQHAGIVLGLGGGAGHPFRLSPTALGEADGRVNCLQDWSAVTAACMVTRTDLYRRVGGMDADRFAVAFNDVDYCLKVRALGQRVVYTPSAELIHHESVSRGYDDSDEKKALCQREMALLAERWASWLRDDPAYHPNLTREATDFSLRKEPVVTLRDWLADPKSVGR